MVFFCIYLSRSLYQFLTSSTSFSSCSTILRLNSIAFLLFPFSRKRSALRHISGFTRWRRCGISSSISYLDESKKIKKSNNRIWITIPTSSLRHSCSSCICVLKTIVFHYYPHRPPQPRAQSKFLYIVTVSGYQIELYICISHHVYMIDLINIYQSLSRLNCQCLMS